MTYLLDKLLSLLPLDWLYRGLLATNMVLISLAGRFKLTSDLYYMFSNKFSAEHQAVLKGRKAYYESLKNIGNTCALLRRNTHRLEKGLIMRPRREIFAEQFIHETVDCYLNVINSSVLSASEKKWATDVLDEYFSVARSTRIIEKAKIKYNMGRPMLEESTSISSGDKNFDILYKPYPHEKLPRLETSYEELKALFLRRRSVRWYQQKSVPFELVSKAVNIASLAPSACNRQPYRFIFCNRKEKAVSIAKCAIGTLGFADNLQAIIAVVGDLSSYPRDRDRHLIYIDGSLAAMQLMLALETLGLSTCPLNWPEIGSCEKCLRRKIDLKDYERVVMLMAVGYAEPGGGIAYSQKKFDKFILDDISK